uniref:Secreted protein n=1 Tax=Ixodes ricinus TaxID=34613 RepID=A0A0K8RKE7_IXORI
MFLSGNFLLNLIVLVALLQLVNAVSKEGSGQGGFMAAMEKIYAMIMDYIKKMLGGESGGAYASKAAEA